MDDYQECEQSFQEIKWTQLAKYNNENILRKTTNFLSLQDMFRQNFCHLQLNDYKASRIISRQKC